MELPPIFVTVKEAARVLAVSDARIFQLMRSGAIERVKAGAKTLIPYKSLTDCAASRKRRQTFPDLNRTEAILADAARVPSKIAYTVPEALAAIGIGRTNLYRLAGEGKLDLRKVGARTLVTAVSLHRLIEQAPKWDGTPDHS